MKMKRKKIRAATTFFLISLVAFAGNAMAERVVQIEADGTVVLDTGKRVQMKGLNFPEETQTVLATLLEGKGIDFEIEEPEDEAQEPAQVFLYVMTNEVNVPFQIGTQPGKQRVMVNELMLQIGAATVKKDFSSRYKESFLTIQKEAEASGQGVWSYEEPVRKISRGRVIVPEVA